MIWRDEWSLGMNTRFTNQSIADLMKTRTGRLISQIQLHGILQVFNRLIDGIPKTGNFDIQTLRDIIFSLTINNIFELAHHNLLSISTFRFAVVQGALSVPLLSPVYCPPPSSSLSRNASSLIGTFTSASLYTMVSSSFLSGRSITRVVGKR